MGLIDSLMEVEQCKKALFLYTLIINFKEPKYDIELALSLLVQDIKLDGKMV